MMMEAKSAMKNCKQCIRHKGESDRAPFGLYRGHWPHGFVTSGFHQD